MYPSWTAPDAWVQSLLASPHPLFLLASHGALPGAHYPSFLDLEQKGIPLAMLPETAWSKLLSCRDGKDLSSWMTREVAGEFIR